MPTEILLLRIELSHGFIACLDVALPIRETVLYMNDDASSAGIVDGVV